MATLERKVVDFKIHNISEEKFQELKDAGQIDPNAIYCTPDETLIKIEEINSKIDSANSRIDLLDSNTVHKAGDETITGIKTFNEPIVSTGGMLAHREDTTGFCEIMGGTKYNDGAFFRADGMDSQDSTENPGGFTCSAYSKENNELYQLRGQADGRLIWRGSEVVTAQGSNDYVVETGLYAHSNGLTWYRKYKSWWVEQGGVITGTNPYVTFPIPMSNLNYTWTLSNFSQYAGERNVRLEAYNQSATGMSVTNTNTSGAATNPTITWEVKGYRGA